MDNPGAHPAQRSQLLGLDKLGFRIFELINGRLQDLVLLRTAKALSEGRAAERVDPWSVVPHYLQAGALEDLGRPGAAREELLQALDLEPRNAATLGLLGDFEARASQKAAAVGWYRRALALDPLDVGLQKLAAGQFSAG